MLLSLVTLAPLFGLATSLPHEQYPLLAEQAEQAEQASNGRLAQKQRPLHGRFLHITDFHPDQFYKPFTSPEKGIACHRGTGPAGVLGAEITDCDSPYTLVNATFQWLNDHVKDSIDFIVWTGDSARHDADEEIPRTEKQVLKSNEMLISKFREVFGKGNNPNEPEPTNDFIIPIVPTFGNNDIMPHNIMTLGPNFWTRKFAHIWRNLIPEAQKHNFDRGGWFFVEVIPNQLAVFNLNTMYFFNHNTAVDGCAKESEPGYEQMEWLRIQLQFLRQRGMKAIIMGHVPPARTDNKESWDSTCWQKYALWMQQYRDVVVGSMYGHMNIDHFMLQDFHDIKKKTRRGMLMNKEGLEKKPLNQEISIQSSIEYLCDLRDGWANIPDAPKSMRDGSRGWSYWRDRWNVLFKQKRKHKSEKEKYLGKIGGEWAERYSVSLVTASIVPNYFPTFRVIEYNITGLSNIAPSSASILDSPANVPPKGMEAAQSDAENDGREITSHKKSKKHGKNKHRKKKGKKPKLAVPSPPSDTSPPGPAYSPQAFTWLGYKQYFVNLTRINAASETCFADEEAIAPALSADSKKSGNKPDLAKFKFELEYDTRNDSVFGMPDLTVRSWVDLARRIGHYQPGNQDTLGSGPAEGMFEEQMVEDALPGLASGEVSWKEEDGLEVATAKQHRKHEKHRGSQKRKNKGKKEKRKEAEELWFTFLRRAYVGAKKDDELREEFAGL